MGIRLRNAVATAMIGLPTVGLCLALLSVGAPGIAAADSVPPPPDPTILVPVEEQPVAAPVDPFAVNSVQTKASPIAAFADALKAVNPGTVLSQAPAVVGGPVVDPLASVSLLLPTSFGMPTGDSASPYVLGAGNNGPYARVNAFKGVHALMHAGLTGRVPGDQLGQALPGTAPEPGTSLPPGLMQYYEDPTALVPPAPESAVVPAPAPVG